MKAKRTILSVLTALFMVASLCAVAAAPAGAAVDGTLDIARNYVSDVDTGASISITVTDADLNTDPNAAESIIVNVVSDTEPQASVSETIGVATTYTTSDSVADSDDDNQITAGDFTINVGTLEGNESVSVTAVNADGTVDLSLTNFDGADEGISYTAGETAELTETDVDTGVFTGTKQVNTNDAVGTLQVAENDTITASYYDTDDASRTGNNQDTATAEIFTVVGADTNTDGVAITPANGPVGKMVTVRVYDTGDFEDIAEGEPLVVKYAGSEVDTTPDEPEMGTQGGVRETIYFDVSDSEKGDHTVKVICGVVSGEEDYTVESKVRIGDNKDQKGSTETVTCTGFNANYGIDVYVVEAGGDPMDYDPDYWNKVGSGTTDDNGTAKVRCTMDYEGAVISAIDGTGYKAQDYDPDGYTFEPGITLDPTSGPVDSEVTIKGSGFTVNAVVNDEDADDYEDTEDAIIEFAGDELHDDLGQEWYDAEDDANVNADGEFEVDFNVPGDATAGTKKVKITLPNSESASASFTVETPTIELDITEGPEGQTVEVTGSGFAAEKENYSLSFDKNDDGYTGIDELKTVDTDANGEFTTSFEVPDVTAGKDKDYDVGILTEAGGTELAGATFHVIASELSISPEEGPTGTKVTVTGEGYPASENFSIVFEDAAEIKYVLRNVATSSLGEFTTTITIPDNAAIGDGTISDTEEENEADFEVTAAKPLLKVEDALNNIWSLVDESVWYYDNSTKTWKQYYKANPSAVPEANRLESMKAGASYWVHVTEDCTLRYGGHVYGLTKGWNSIGWIG